MADFVLDIADFRVKFPAFADAAMYPDATIQGAFDSAGCTITNQNYGLLSGDCRLFALYLMTAHLLVMRDGSISGDTPKVVTSSTVDKVSNSFAESPIKSSLDFYLSTSAYGLELLALLSTKAVGGYALGALPERSAIRRFGGYFM